MLSRSKEYREKIETLKREREILSRQYKELKAKQKEAQRELVRWNKAKEILQIVGKATQEQLQEKISELVSLGVETIFEDTYRFMVEFVERRGKVECDLWLVNQSGEKIHPVDSVGLGVADAVSIGLRAVSFSMRQGNKSPIIILDEPFKFLSVGLRDRAGQFLKYLSEYLGIQMLVVTHSQEIAEYGDKQIEL